jgi:hypothetical protein
MELELKLRRKSNTSVTDKISVPVSPDLKQQIEELKRSYGVDFNHAARVFFQNLVTKVRSGQITIEE